MTEFLEPKPRFWSKPTVDRFAARIAKDLGVQPGDELVPVVEDIGGEIVYGYEEIDEYSGGSIVVRDLNDFTILLSEVTSPKRDRFTIAHELGHLCMHYEPLVNEFGEGVVMRATRDKRDGDPAHERAEWEANWFAAGFLMPANIFGEKSEKLKDRDLAVFFNVSDDAVRIRKKTLGI